MDNLPFREESVDLFWAEGSAFIIGFKEALHSWKWFLKPQGYMAFSDCVWFTKTPTDECREYFSEKYPAMMHEEDVKTIIGKSGYSVLDIIRLPDAAWWDYYYNPFSRKTRGHQAPIQGRPGSAGTPRLLCRGDRNLP